MGKDNPKVSIIVPTYNRANYLNECLESIINQDYPNLEIIVSDDNSTDNTYGVVKDFQNKYGFIKYVKNNKYLKGPLGNKNNGLDYATGDVIGIFDDDIMLKGAINLLVEKIKDGYDMVFANCIRSDNNEFSGKGLDKTQEVKWQDYLCGRIRGEFWGLFTKENLGNKRFDTKMHARESLLWNKLWINKKVFYIHRAVRFYRIHNESVMNSDNKNYVSIMKTYEKEIKEYGNYMKKFCPCQLSFIYSLSGYFAKLSGNIRKSFKYSLNGIKICPSNKRVYLVFLFNFLPKNFIIFLINLKKRFK